jgi:YD repeat-containing protein
MNKRNRKKETEKTLYPFGKRLKNRNKNLRIYFKPDDIPNWVWIFWYGDGRINHWGIHKESVLDITSKGFYVGGEKVDTYVITDLDLHIIAEGGEWVEREPIQIYGRYAQVGGYYIEECNGQEQHRPKRLDGGRYVDLKTKRAYDWDPEVYGEEPCSVSLVGYPGVYDSAKKVDQGGKRKMEHFEFHWAGMPKNIANMIFRKMGYVNISWRDNYGKKIYKRKREGNVWYENSNWNFRETYEKYKERGEAFETWGKYDENGNKTYYKRVLDYKYTLEENWWDYDENGNMIYSRDKRGIETWREYDINGNMIHEKNNRGREEWKEYNENNELISRIGSYLFDGCEQRTEWRKKYNEEGYEIYIKDSDGKESWKQYDKKITT